MTHFIEDKIEDDDASQLLHQVFLRDLNNSANYFNWRMDLNHQKKIVETPFFISNHRVFQSRQMQRYFDALPKSDWKSTQWQPLHSKYHQLVNYEYKVQITPQDQKDNFTLSHR